MKRIFLLLSALSFFLNAVAQLSIQDNQTALSLAQTLTGAGVIVLNPTLNCPGIANGRFQSNNTVLGLDSGIVLTSGRAKSISGGVGINGPTSSFPSTANNTPGDPDLTALINSNSGGNIGSNDACILEFSFIPAGDTIKFDYVFGSEEYDGNNGNFNCSINDVFGFFISGPGIPAPRNIAIVPGTTNVMVGISTINNGNGNYAGSSCYYNTNNVGPYTQYFNDIYAANNMDIAYNGLTDVFTAYAGVMPCDTYHLKLAIADASDNVWDSGVFLKAGSLNSTGIQLTPESTAGANTDTAHCIRGCKSGHIAFSRPTPRPTPLTIKYIISGTAQNGIDYQSIIDSIVIPANQTVATLEIKPLSVQYPSGPKYVTISALSPYNCSGTATPTIIDSTSIWIFDSLYVAIPTAPITVCPQTEVTITADIDASLNFVWSPAALIPDPLPLGLTIHPKPVVPTTYMITVSQPGAPVTCPTVSRSYRAIVEPIPQLVLPSHDTTVCLSDSVDISIHANPVNLNYIYTWSPATFLRDTYDANNKFFAPVGDYKYVITATTPVAHCFNKDSMNVHVVPPFTFQSVTPIDTTIRYGDKVKLSSESEAIYWIWDPITYLDDPLARQPWAMPLQNTKYTLIGINQYGCRDSAYVNIKVKYESNAGMANAFSPNGDGLNDVFKIQNIQFEKMTEFKVFNRWGKCVYDGNDPLKGWDGTFNGQKAAADVYYYQIKLTMPDASQKVLKGDITLIR
jgi:gliding motility-associated-like protein